MQKLDNIEVHIVKMRESSGNEQFFIRLFRNDAQKGKFFTDALLEHSCWQTKHLDKKECLERAWFDASYLARFVGLTTMDDVKIIGLDDEETIVLKKAMTRRLG